MIDPEKHNCSQKNPIAPRNAQLLPEKNDSWKIQLVPPSNINIFKLKTCNHF